MRVISILFFVAIILQSFVNSQYSTPSDLKCVRDRNDQKSCSFSHLTDPMVFYKDLNNMVDSNRLLITKIYFKDCELTNIPKELTINFPNIVNLDASNLRLTRLQSYDFSSSSKIQYLNISQNYLSGFVEKGLPDFMNRLINLDMSHNVIDRVDDDVLNYNQDFKYLNLSHNRIGKIGMDFLRSVRSLEILKLDNNRITKIYGDGYGLKMNLKELHLQNNNLKTFDLSIIPSASYLDLSHNEIKEELDFSGTNLTDLNVSHNLLQSIKINQNLLTLDASSNEDSSFEIDFNGNKVLTKLVISNLDIPSFASILKKIQQLSNLKHLDISKNTIETFDFSHASFPKSLEHLDLSRCEIHSMTGWENMKNLLPNIKYLDVRGNYLHCDDMKNFVIKFQDSNILVGFNNTEQNEYINKNCFNDHHKHKEKEYIAQIESNGQNKILWAFLIIMLLGYIFGALYFANRRFNLVNEIVERATGSGFTRQEFTNC